MFFLFLAFCSSIVAFERFEPFLIDVGINHHQNLKLNYRANATQLEHYETTVRPFHNYQANPFVLFLASCAQSADFDLLNWACRLSHHPEEVGFDNQLLESSPLSAREKGLIRGIKALSLFSDTPLFPLWAARYVDYLMDPTQEAFNTLHTQYPFLFTHSEKDKLWGPHFWDANTDIRPFSIDGLWQHVLLCNANPSLTEVSRGVRKNFFLNIALQYAECIAQEKDTKKTMLAKLWPNIMHDHRLVFELSRNISQTLLTIKPILQNQPPSLVLKDFTYRVIHELHDYEYSSNAIAFEHIKHRSFWVHNNFDDHAQRKLGALNSFVKLLLNQYSFYPKKHESSALYITATVLEVLKAGYNHNRKTWIIDLDDLDMNDLNAIRAFNKAVCDIQLHRIFFCGKKTTHLGNDFFFKIPCVCEVSLAGLINLEKIGDFCFYMCNSLAEAHIGRLSKLQSIGSKVFSSCRELTFFTSYLETIESIGESFLSTTNLKNVVFHFPQIRSFGGNLLSMNRNLIEASFIGTSNLQEIGGGLFWGSNIQRITIPAGRTSQWMQWVRECQHDCIVEARETELECP